LAGKKCPGGEPRRELPLPGGADGGFVGRKAGQYAVIRVMRKDGWSEPHPFTISCAPEVDYLQFT
jgi:predicted ferric reductase